MERELSGVAVVPTTSHHGVDPLEVLHDPARIAALRRLRLLDSSAEGTFDRLARIAKTSIGVPVALISLVAEHRQFFTSCLGLAEPWASARETPLSHSFCQYAVATGEELVVEDARVDKVLTTNLAIRDLGVVAYAGVPIRVGDGVPIGTLCVIDSRPRRWTQVELELLRDLAGAVGDLLEPRLALLRAPERQAVLAQLVEAQEEERARIAAEVHDDILQTLVAVSLRLQVLAEKGGGEGGAGGVGDPAIAALATQVTAAADRLRRLLADLRPYGLDQGVFGSALAERIDLEFDEGTAVDVQVDHDAMPPAVGTTLYRVAQEALANIRAHAGAGHVSVRVARAGGGVELTVRDDGRGFDPAQQASGRRYGLMTMRERTELLGGSLQIESSPGAGTLVRAWLPLPPETAG